MTAIIENKHTIPRHPAHVLDAEKTLRAEAPGLYIKVSRFRDCKSLNEYEKAKIYLELSHYSYEKYHKVLADFCNV
ncbi:MAG TPA: hypothetical protein P5519_12120 [Spirochaetia bacterium]|nr:hypothetical protein [Spirochaetia bacterium]